MASGLDDAREDAELEEARARVAQPREDQSASANRSSLWLLSARAASVLQLDAAD